GVRVGTTPRHRHDQLRAGVNAFLVLSTEPLRIACAGGSAEVAAIPDLPGDALREPVLIGDVEYVPAAVYEHHVVEPLHDFVRTFVLTPPRDDLGSVDDVLAPEWRRRLRILPSERLVARLEP